MNNPAGTSQEAASRAPFADITRLAPSPTGTLHLGNARTFLINWALARNLNWKIILRIEDLDVTRVRSGAADSAIDLLRWIGIDWDDGPFTQSHDLEPYRAAMRQLAAARLAYGCAQTRKQIEQAASAPHAGDREMRFPLQWRPPTSDPDAYRFDRSDMNHRFTVPPGAIIVNDRLAGQSTHDPFNECGDFIIWTKLGVPAYQLAVVVDDARQGVTDVVRGDDLLPSAARQTLLYRALGYSPPNWWHVPLVLAEDGRRLAKRQDDAHLISLRRAGVPPGRVIGLLGSWCGVGDCDNPQPMEAAEFRARFNVDMLPPEAVHLTRRNLEWLIRD